MALVGGDEVTSLPGGFYPTCPQLRVLKTCRCSSQGPQGGMIRSGGDVGQFDSSSFAQTSLVEIYMASGEEFNTGMEHGQVHYYCYFDNLVFAVWRDSEEFVTMPQTTYIYVNQHNWKLPKCNTLVNQQNLELPKRSLLWGYSSQR